MKTTLKRILLCALCAMMLLGTLALPISADELGEPVAVVLAEEEIELLAASGGSGAALPAPTLTDDGETAKTQVAESEDDSFFKKLTDWFFRNFGLIGFILDPYQFTIINQKPVFQFALGFNDLYDIFPFVMNVYADTVKCEFNYEGKDWRIQLWKGGYGVCLATGGEIGVYNKSETVSIDHYGCPADTNDWLFMEYTIYNRGEKLFTRPSPFLSGDVGPYWWCPGYKVFSICTDFLSSPRANVIMDATIQFKSAEMARLFVGKLAEKGFSELASGAFTLQTPEKYKILADGKSVRLVWQNVNEGWY